MQLCSQAYTWEQNSHALDPQGVCCLVAKAHEPVDSYGTQNRAWRQALWPHSLDRGGQKPGGLPGGSDVSAETQRLRTERAGKDVGLVGRGRLFLAGVTAQAGAGRLQRAGCGQVSGYSPTGAERRGDCERRERNARLLLRVDADQSPTTRGPCRPGLRRGLCSRAPREPWKGLKAGSHMGRLCFTNQ